DWVTGSFADRSRLRQENLELTARLRLANLQLQRFAVLEEENRRLRDMRANTAGIAEKVLVASILNVDLDPFRHRVLLDKGAVDGVFKGQAVLDGDGIFGQVSKVNASTAEVILISDAEHAIPVQSNRSGVRTIAVGTGDQNKLSLPFVTVESDLQQGDLLLSTGMGGVFPSGYPVAQVSKVKRAGSTFALVEAKPTAKLDQAREVLLVWFKARVEPVPAATGTEAAAAADTAATTGRSGPVTGGTAGATPATANRPAAATRNAPATTPSSTATLPPQGAARPPATPDTQAQSPNQPPNQSPNPSSASPPTTSPTTSPAPATAPPVSAPATTPAPETPAPQAQAGGA
ncbi:MAG: hypothetical protein RL261_1296, partial [Pseudomonadota bacterium]